MRELIARRIAGAAIASLILASTLVGAGRAQLNKPGPAWTRRISARSTRPLSRHRRRLLKLSHRARLRPALCRGPADRDSIRRRGGRQYSRPDLETGIGAWSDELFVRALREGKGHNGELLYPAMPYPYYTKLTESDALAIRAYLNTVKPVHNAVVSNKLPFPFDVREGMAAWNALYFRSGESRKPDPTKPAEWNRWRLSGRRPGPLRRLSHAEVDGLAAAPRRARLSGLCAAGMVRAQHHQ